MVIGIQQDRQHHVAAAGAHQHRGEERPDGRVAERAGGEQRREQQRRSRRSAPERTARRAARSISSVMPISSRMPSQLAEIERRPVGRREQQRAQRLGLPLALERARRAPACRQNAIAIHRMPADTFGDRAAFLDEGEREHQHARDREEHRRRHQLPAAHLDGDVLAHDEPRDAGEVVMTRSSRRLIALAQRRRRPRRRGPAGRCAGRARATAALRPPRDRAWRR